MYSGVDVQTDLAYRYYFHNEVLDAPFDEGVIVGGVDIMYNGKIIGSSILVTGESIVGANFVKDFFASITDIVGGRSSSYEGVLRKAKDAALQEMEQRAAAMGANAVIGVDLDYETVGANGSMLMVTASGTAVNVED